MAGVKLSKEELEGATEIAPVKLSPDEIAGATPLEEPAEKPSFLEEAGSRIAAPFKAAGNLISNATLPTSGADLLARLKQNGAEVGRALVAPVRSAYSGLNAVGNAVLHPIDTFANGGAGAAFRETSRGLGSAVPLLNLANEHVTGFPENSEEDAARAPGFRDLGATAAAPVVAKAGANVAESAAGALERAGPAATERSIGRATERLAEGASKRNRLNVTESAPVEDLVREHPEIQKAAGNDAKVKAGLDKVTEHARAQLDTIYKATEPTVDLMDPVNAMGERIRELRKGTSSDAAVARDLAKIRDEFAARLAKRKSVSPQDLRAEQTDYQKKGWGKALPGDEAGTNRIAANQEAAKAVGDAVIRHVSGMDYVTAKEFAAANPDSLIADLFKANDRINAANRIEAAMTDRARAPKSGPGVAGKLLHFAKHARHSPLGAVAAPALEAAAGGIDVADRGIASAAPAAAPLARAAGPGNASHAFGGLRPNDLLEQLVARADGGDQAAQAKLDAISGSPIVAARIAALRRKLAPELSVAPTNNPPLAVTP